MSPGTSRTLNSLALKAWSWLAHSVLWETPGGAFPAQLTDESNRGVCLTHQPVSGSSSIPLVILLSSLAHRSTLPALLPSELTLLLSGKLPLTPNSCSSFNVIVSSHSARPDGQHRPLHLSRGCHHMLQESMVCVPPPYSSLDSKASTTLPHPGTSASILNHPDTVLPRNPQPVLISTVTHLPSGCSLTCIFSASQTSSPHFSPQS